MKILTKWCFFKSILSNCFLLSSAFLQYFLLTNLMMVFLEPLLDLPILWHSSTSLDSTLTSIPERIYVTIDSSSESWTLSGMPEISKLFLLPYCSRVSWEDSISATLFSNCFPARQPYINTSCCYCNFYYYKLKKAGQSFLFLRFLVLTQGYSVWLI